MHVTPIKVDFIVESVQKWSFDFYIRVGSIFHKPLEKSLRIMYNI